jgi:hypothetical protein
MWPFDQPKRLQKVLIVTEDGRIIPTVLNVEKGYMVDHKTHEAWGLYPDSLVRKANTNDMYALLDERDAAPMVVEGKGITQKSLKELITDIAKESRKQTQYEVQEKQIKDRLAKAMTIAITCCAICLIVVVIFSIFFQ